MYARCEIGSDLLQCPISGESYRSSCVSGRHMHTFQYKSPFLEFRRRIIFVESENGINRFVGSSCVWE